MHQTFAVIAITAYLTLLTYQVGTDLFGAETIGEVVVKYQTLIAGAFASLSVYAVLRQIAEEKRRYTHGVKRSNDREFRALVDLLAELQSGRFETRELPDGELGFGILWPFGLLLPHLGEVFSRHLFEHSTPRVNERLRRFNEAVSDYNQSLQNAKPGEGWHRSTIEYCRDRVDTEHQAMLSAINERLAELLEEEREALGP